MTFCVFVQNWFGFLGRLGENIKSETKTIGPFGCAKKALCHFGYESPIRLLVSENVQKGLLFSKRALPVLSVFFDVSPFLLCSLFERRGAQPSFFPSLSNFTGAKLRPSSFFFRTRSVPWSVLGKTQKVKKTRFALLI
jgi:hypothetical protein